MITPFSMSQHVSCSRLLSQRPGEQDTLHLPFRLCARVCSRVGVRRCLFICSCFDAFLVLARWIYSEGVRRRKSCNARPRNIHRSTGARWFEMLWSTRRARCACRQAEAANRAGNQSANQARSFNLLASLLLACMSVCLPCLPACAPYLQALFVLKLSSSRQHERESLYHIQA